MKNTRLLWFGDSYTIGNELGYHEGEFVSTEFDINIPYISQLDRKRSRPDLAFTTLTSRQLGLDFLNFGAGGAAISYLQYQLINFIRMYNDTSFKHIAVFCLPIATNRYFSITNDSQILYHNGDKVSSDILDQQDRTGIYETTMLLNSIYSLCKLHNVDCYFVSTWSKIKIMDWVSIVPQDAWLLPSNVTLVETAWDFYDPPETWRSVFNRTNPVYNKYIYPCENHPNVLGHTKLANILASLMREKCLT